MNKLCQIPNSLVAIGADAVALYPSLKARLSGQAVYRAVLESDLMFDMVDNKEAARYIALTHTKSEVRIHHLRRILPWRRNKKGVRPTIIGPAAQGPEAGEEEQWRFPNVALTAIEKKMLVAEVMRIAVEAVFQTHVYQF